MFGKYGKKSYRHGQPVRRGYSLSRLRSVLGLQTVSTEDTQVHLDYDFVVDDPINDTNPLPDDSLFPMLNDCDVNFAQHCLRIWQVICLPIQRPHLAKTELPMAMTNFGNCLKSRLQIEGQT